MGRESAITLSKKQSKTNRLTFCDNDFKIKQENGLETYVAASNAGPCITWIREFCCISYQAYPGTFLSGARNGGERSLFVFITRGKV